MHMLLFPNNNHICDNIAVESEKYEFQMKRQTTWQIIVLYSPLYTADLDEEKAILPDQESTIRVLPN